ncbi:TPA: hypothetical protein ACGO91_001873 [Streptococcus suis]
MKTLTQKELVKTTGGSIIGLIGKGKTLRSPRIYLPGPVKPKLEVM